MCGKQELASCVCAKQVLMVIHYLYGISDVYQIDNLGNTGRVMWLLL